MLSKKWVVCKAVVALCGCLLLVSAHADDYQLETIVVTGRPVATPLGDIAGSVGIVDQQTLNLVQHSHINESADRISGVWISRGNGQEHLTAIRSPVLTGPGSCGSFLILEDGIPTRPAGFCNVNQLFELNSEQAERIEIYRGPDTSVYGSSALHGVINIISPAIAAREETSVLLDGGPHDYARTFLSYSDGTGLRLNAHGDHDGGYKDDSGYDQQKLNVKSSAQQQNWRVINFVEATNLNQETASYIDGNNAYKDDSRKNDNPHPQAYRDATAMHGYSKWVGQLDNDSSIELTPYANTSEMNFLQHFIRGTPTEKNGHLSLGLNGKFLDSEMLASRNLSYAVGFNLESARAYVDQYQENPATPPSVLFPAGQHYDFDVWMHSAALFTDLAYAFTTEWKLNVGLRYDYQYYDYDNKATPIAGSIYNPIADRDDEYGERSINAGVIWQWLPQHQSYVNGSQGYRIPQVAEVYRLQGATPDQVVDSEQVESIEFGFRGTFYDIPGDRLHYETALFGMRKNNVILQDSNRQYLGNGITDHEGVEVTLNYWMTPTAYINLAATYAEHRYDHIERPLLSSTGNIDGNTIDTAPRHFGSVQLGKSHSWGLIEIEWKHMGPYYLDPEHDWSYEGHNLVNFRAKYWPRTDLEWTVRLLNVTNIDYAERADVRPAAGALSEVPRYFVGEPRSLYVSIEKTFY